MAEQVIQGWSETEMEGLRRIWEDMAILDHNTWLHDKRTITRARIMRRARTAALREGRAEGLREGQQQLLETARKFKAMGLSLEQIAAGTGLSAQELAAL
jgi:predicted transposase/invertase (TIGR01784 family)